MRNYKVPPIPDSVWKNPLHFIAFGFGSGVIPFAPGTFGTLMAIPFYLLLGMLPPFFYFVSLVVIIILSVWICDRVSKEIGVQDHQGMCLDEFAGFFVTMFLVPMKWQWILLGFV